MYDRHLKLVYSKYSKPVNMKRCTASYLFDIRDLQEFAEILTPATTIFKEAEDIEPGLRDITESWQYYLEEALWEQGLNVVRTASVIMSTEPYVRYLRWKITNSRLIKGLLPYPELKQLHGPDECYVYIRGTSMLLAFY